MLSARWFQLPTRMSNETRTDPSHTPRAAPASKIGPNVHLTALQVCLGSRNNIASSFANNADISSVVRTPTKSLAS